MNITVITCWADQQRQRLRLPPIDVYVAVFADGTYRRVRTGEQLRRAVEQSGKIQSGLSVYDLANPAQWVLAAVLIQLDRYQRHRSSGNTDGASRAVLQVGAIYGAWKWQERESSRTRQLLKIQPIGTQCGTAELKRKAEERRQNVLLVARDLWQQHRHLIGKYLRTAKAIHRNWRKYHKTACPYKERTLRRIISEQYRHGALVDFWPSPE